MESAVWDSLGCENVNEAVRVVAISEAGKNARWETAGIRERHLIQHLKSWEPLFKLPREEIKVDIQNATKVLPMVIPCTPSKYD